VTRIVVTGAGGFIGWHLVSALRQGGHQVRGVDVKRPEFGATTADEFVLADLRDPGDCGRALRDADEVWMLAANMGGMGFITCNDAEIMHDNLLIDVNTLNAACRNGARKVIYTSSACVYPNYLQGVTGLLGLAEHEVMPADPQHGYGWAKLTAERLLEAYHTEGRVQVRVARLHAIYGPQGTWQGGREKAPAALCRKVAEAPDGGTVEVWGDGQQTRSFCYITDCITGLLSLAASGYPLPVNIGSAELTTIDGLARQIIDYSGKRLEIRHVTGPQGVRGRCSDNAIVREVLGWEPGIPLRNGIAATYDWVASQVREVSHAA
jgi:GDP-D-mannose 3', 5'-epimerase